MRVRRLLADDVSLIATIDRSEHVDIQHAVIDGRLTEQPVTMAEVPPWDPAGSGPHSVAAKIGFCASTLAAGAGSIYVSAIPTGSAVGFYLSQGGRLARLPRS